MGVEVGVFQQPANQKVQFLYLDNPVSDEKSLVTVKDVFGIGSAINSKAAENLVGAIIDGIGSISAPWLLKREVKNKLELQKLVQEELGLSGDVELSLSDRANFTSFLQRISAQQNKEEISRIAIENANFENDGQTCQSLENEWVNRFWKLGEQVSDQKLQSLWAKILNSASGGKSISSRTLETISYLSKDEAEHIERLAAFKVAIGPDLKFERHTIGLLLNPTIELPNKPQQPPNRVFINGNHIVTSGEEGEGQIKEIRESAYPTLGHIFGPYGIYTEGGFAHRFSLNWNHSSLPIQIGNKEFDLIGVQPNQGEDASLVSFGTGVGFSQVGWEIFSLADVPPNPLLMKIFEKACADSGLELAPRTH